MANKEHLAILDQGIEIWNNWRKENPTIMPDLRGADLSNQIFDGFDFRGVNFERYKEGIYIFSTNLCDASLKGADLSESNLKKSNLSGVNFTDATLIKANLYDSNMIGATLTNAKLREANLSEACLFGAQLQNANLLKAYLIKTNLSEANLTNADLRLADLTQASLWRACLDGVNFTKTYLIKANLTEAILTGVCIQNWNIGDTKLDDVVCRYIYLKNDQKERLPPTRDFGLGEFSKLFRANRSYSSLAVLDQLIHCFEKLLNDFPEGNESIFHDFLKKNPILIDIYASQQDIFSKPRFHCPPGKLLNGKKYVEPDFIIRYPGNKYKLVELEKPEKRIATKQGQQTCDVTQAEFQTKEWEDYIRNYIDRIRDKYPGIANSRSYLVVIGRRNEKSIGIGRDPARYMGLINSNYPHEEICTYDDLLDRAKQAHSALISLSI